MSLISKVKLPGQNTPYDIGVQWDNVKNKPTLATVATSGNYNDLSNKPIIPDETVVVTADISSNPILFMGLIKFLGGADEIIPWTSTYSSDLISALESGAATKFTDIITNSKQGIFKIKFKNTANANADVEFNFPLDAYASLNTNASNPTYALMGQMGSSNSAQTHPRTFYVGIMLAVTSSATTISQIVLSTGNAEEIIANLFKYDSSISSPSYKLRLSHGGTGLSANDADNWYTSNTLHPHFTVNLNPLNATFTCQYQGPLPDTVSSVSDALATDEVQYALKQPVPVIIPMLNNRLIGNGLIDNYVDFISSNTSMRILFTDWVYFNRTYVNGINGTLNYTSADGLFLDNVAINFPKAIDSSTSAPDMIVQAAVGDLSVGSTSVPVYWTGSRFAETAAIPTVPTNVSAFTNDANYINQTQLNTAISNINSFNVQVVASLPTTNIDTHTIYFISNSGSGQNIYDEYMYLNNTWEKIGTTDVDLSGYLTSSDFTNVSAYTSGGQVTQTNFTTTSITPATFANVTASKASAGTAVSVYKGGGAVSQTSFTSGAAFTIAEGTVTANSAYQDGGTVSQAAFTTQSITPYTFTDVTASKATTQTAVTVHTGGGTISQTPFGTTTTSHVNS